ncbi:flagellar export protein FliJ [Zhenpiania hominis]|uniref:Flagellar FliJ protein n=1 Tax=Zhenpiania hominis TaxID=2763644 RepID=A0A923NLL1_9FIRM|nr:flagellar export protein FliJ [Zhenpiania hominis]MBC6678308.1 flagellar export protein FliJ [Zhenpiania hominis]
MKKFSFSLNKVLDYKTQIEDSLRSEHAEAVKAVNEKEEKIQSMEDSYYRKIQELNDTKKNKCSIKELCIYEDYLSYSSQQIRREKDRLVTLQKKEQEKREEVIEAKKERRSIDLLKDKKKKEYDALAQKEEERFIEEFVVNSRSAQSNPA